jgi:hypothetical protein
MNNVNIMDCVSTIISKVKLEDNNHRLLCITKGLHLDLIDVGDKKEQRVVKRIPIAWAATQEEIKELMRGEFTVSQEYVHGYVSAVRDITFSLKGLSKS